MASYFLDDHPTKNGIRKVRSAFCPDLPDFYSRIYLGEFDRIEEAEKKARIYHKDTTECAGCRLSNLLKSASENAKLLD